MNGTEYPLPSITKLVSSRFNKLVHLRSCVLVTFGPSVSYLG